MQVNLCIEPIFLLQIRLRKLICDKEEENSQLAHMKLSLEESCEQVPSSVGTITQVFFSAGGKELKHFICSSVRYLKVTSNILDKSNDLKQLREQICRLDEQLGSRMQVKFSQIWQGMGRFFCSTFLFIFLCVNV